MSNGQREGERHGWTMWRGVTCVECPTCGFTFDADHEDHHGGGYSCPICTDATPPEQCPSLPVHTEGTT